MELNAEQKRIATQEPRGHSLLRGVAGSGKTSVGIYRVSFLLNNFCFAKDDAILLATFNRTLINYMAHLYKKMAGRQQAEFATLFETPQRKVDIKTVDSLIFSHYQNHARKKGLRLDSRVSNAFSYEVISEGISKLKKQHPSVQILNQKNTPFLLQEINWIKDCLYLEEEEYQGADRMGLGRSHAEHQPQRLRKNSETRRAIFQLMRFYDEVLHRSKMISYSEVRLLALEEVRQAAVQKYTHIIVDESQDLTRSQLLFLQQIYQEKDYSSLLFIADTAQNIYPQSWLGSGNSFASIGFNMKGRSSSLSKNFRTTTQISQAAYSLIATCPEIVEDENFVPPALIDKKGVYPVCKAFTTEAQQVAFVAREIGQFRKTRPLGDMVIIARFKQQLINLQQALNSRQIDCTNFANQEISFDTDTVKLVTMHSIKGLEFPIVFMVGLDARVLPYISDSDVDGPRAEEIKERKLLYVGMTRATEHLYLSSCGSPSKFIADIDPRYLRVDSKSRIASFYNIPIDDFRYRRHIQQPHSVEEKVRQWVIAELRATYGYPRDCITIEFPVKAFSRKGYVDVAVHINKRGQAVPFIFIETKRRGHSLADALDQVKSYLSNCHLCDYGAVTDGHELVVIDRTFTTVEDLPVFRNTWGLADTISSVYRQLKTGRETRFCYDPNQPTSLELEWGGECELVEKEGLERLPVYGRIAAGQPIHLNPELDQEIYLPKSWVAGGQYFILKVYGDSMTGAAIDDGDLVLVRAQDAADNLDVVVVALGEEGTLKRFSKMGSSAILLAENPKYDPILLEDEQVRIMGIAVGVIKNASPRS